MHATNEAETLFEVGKSAALDAGNLKENNMAWTTPVTTEVCVGMEVTSYASAEI